MESEVCNFFASFQSPLVNKYKGPSITGRRDSGESSPAVDRLDQMVRQAKEGNAKAFQELYRSYGKKILNYVYRMTGSRDAAEDLTQDTFVLAYRNLKFLKENARFQNWLFRIAQNNIYQGIGIGRLRPSRSKARRFGSSRIRRVPPNLSGPLSKPSSPRSWNRSSRLP